MARKSLKNVDMELVTKYMVEHDCKLDEAIAAVQEQSTPAPEPKPVKERTPIKEATTKLKAVRLRSGLSQSQLAKEADLNVRTLQTYEQGHRNFDNARIDTILKVALACNCKLEDLIESEEYLDLMEKYHEMV